MGISRENLPHVFRPYFTTKDRGSMQTGLWAGVGHLPENSPSPRRQSKHRERGEKGDHHSGGPAQPENHSCKIQSRPGPGGYRVKTILLLAEKPGFAEAVRAVLDAARYRVVYQNEIRSGDVLLTQGRVDACILGRGTDDHPAHSHH